MDFIMFEAFDGNREALRLMIRFSIDIFLAILFLQSGFDKILNWTGNFDWLKGYFAKTPLRTAVKPLLGTLTILEVSSGLVAATAAIDCLLGGGLRLSLAAYALCTFTFIALFFGQRLAKDYAGAAANVPYFVLSIFGLYFLS